MAKLSPVMSWIAMFFHCVVESLSPSQETVQVEPALNTWPGPGSLGVTSAWATPASAKAAMRVETESLENILSRVLGCHRGQRSPHFKAYRKTHYAM